MAQKNYDIKYDITQSPLYKLRSKKKLISLLNLGSLSDLKSIMRTDSPYRKFPIMSKGKLRPVEVPSRVLLPIHNRLFRLLKKIHLPSYLHSGVKGCSYLSNARAHRDRKEAYTLDIKKFYPSVTRAKVVTFFRETMKCEPDISAILANITTCDDHIPTGSSLSQVLAYLSCKEMFDALHDLSQEAGVTFTCYVDDLTFSGDRISKKWIYDRVKPMINKFGMRSHKDKHFRAGQVKEITGVIVDGCIVKVCNRMHQSIHKLTLQIAETEEPLLIDSLYDKLIGKLCAAGQIEERFKLQRVMATKTRRKLLGPKFGSSRIKLNNGNQEIRKKLTPILPSIWRPVDHLDESIPWD
ncbi:reverse transcriptase family protein [Geomonas subterranea]|uniref:Reverse transcriptase family protein n=1 Tax=Geomonas subterranea TaxID=2847989 RepID=A0ABX8LLJ7_9BACT|nr:reverse transcriptase family protein [Geomonas subterranea]QXE92552.1 reverse transcriptase family protein [Geomonas subterranea]QXM09350.1 reverse transcriptase family protein [Geomonas subterranea]